MPSASNKKVKPPPDYFSRRVQLRLLMAVASLLLVVSLMFEARKPENWQWMWNGIPTDTSSDEVDTRLPPLEPDDPIGTVYANTSPDPTTVIQEASHDEQAAALRRLELDAWTKLLTQLERADRMALDQVLLTARTPGGQSADVDATWSTTLTKITEAYTSYLNDANTAVMLSGDSLADRQKESLLNALREMETGWNDQLLPALQAPLEMRSWSERDREELDGLQALLDELAIKSIRDDSFWRPDERDAWFRWFEKLKQTDVQQLNRLSSGQVGFLQLFKQSDEYRGKLVTIRGSARMAYRVRAPENIHGITGYVVYWVKPQGGPNSPIVVYALETPVGFPDVKEKGRDGATTTLNEEVAFTGYFFKRWAYPSQNGLQTAPLLLARGPTWLGSTSGQERAWPGWTVAAGSVAAVLVLSIAFAVLVYRAGKGAVGEGTSLRKANPDQLEALKEQAVLPRPEDALRRLAAADREEQRE